MSFGSSIKNCLKFVARPLFSAGKVISSAGQTLFGVQGAAAYILEVAEGCVMYNPIVMGIALGFVAADVFINLMTRVPAIYHQLRTIPEPIPSLQTDKPKPSFTERVGNVCRGIGNFCKTTASIVCSPRRLLGYSVFGFTVLGGVVSSQFSSLAAYLGAVKLPELSEFFLKNHQDECAANDHHSTYSDTVRTALYVYGAVIALSSLMSFISFNLKKVWTNSKKLRDRIINEDSKKRPLNKIAFGLAFFMTLLNLAGNIGLAFRGTMSALGKLPKFLNADKQTKVSVWSTISSSSTLLTTTPFALYNFFDQFFSKERDELLDEMFKQYSKLSTATKIIGIFSSIGIGLSNLAGITALLAVLGANPYAWGIILLGGLSGLSTAVSNYAFTIIQGLEDYLKMKISAIEDQFIPVPEDDKIEVVVERAKPEKKINLQDSDFSHSSMRTLLVDQTRSINTSPEIKSAAAAAARPSSNRPGPTRHSQRLFKPANQSASDRKVPGRVVKASTSPVSTATSQRFVSQMKAKVQMTNAHPDLGQSLLRSSERSERDPARQAATQFSRA
jgi:hypothetical protein